jgi:hypothetical protein
MQSADFFRGMHVSHARVPAGTRQVGVRVGKSRVGCICEGEVSVTFYLRASLMDVVRLRVIEAHSSASPATTA